MKTTYQYRIYPQSSQKVQLTESLRICRYWYNRMLGERINWWEQNRCSVNACPLVCHLPELKDRPNYYNQKLQLPVIKEDLVLVKWSGELLNFNGVYSTILQDVCKRVEKAMTRYIQGDKNGKRSGRPRIKNESRYRTMVFDGAKNEWLKFCTVNGKWLYLKLPKIGLVKVRTHRPLPAGFNLKQVSVTKKSDGWYANFVLDARSVPEFKPEEIVPTWDNSMGIDAVLNEDIYLATSEGKNLPSLKPLRKSLGKLGKLQTKKNARKKGSSRRRKLAKHEGKLHQQIARSRKDFQYKTAHKLVRTGKKVFFHEALNIAGLTKRNAPKQDGQGKYLYNGQSAKSGLNKSWLDAAYGQFFSILGYIAGKAGASVIEKNPAYTSQLLSYKDEFVFTDCSIRSYWDEELKLWVDRDVNAAINLKRVGLDVFPTIKRRRGNPVVVSSTTNSTAKEVLTVLFKASVAHALP
ncbi:MAG: transposase [Coleofasciculus sp. G1-WW12-02]|uniref:RNA-guided endonuclease InsQ/TnpB family protein n=1 Tax=Coleofasciculus sp. G1-WW12-02 TaxID=3068483 RepID=UPI0032F4D352